MHSDFCSSAREEIYSPFLSAKEISVKKLAGIFTNAQQETLSMWVISELSEELLKNREDFAMTVCIALFFPVSTYKVN